MPSVANMEQSVSLMKSAARSAFRTSHLFLVPCALNKRRKGTAGFPRNGVSYFALDRRERTGQQLVDPSSKDPPQREGVPRMDPRRP